jgi:hypothetical protein
VNLEDLAFLVFLENFANPAILGFLVFLANLEDLAFLENFANPVILGFLEYLE